MNERAVPKHFLLSFKSKIGELLIILKAHRPIDIKEAREKILAGENLAGAIDGVHQLLHERVRNLEISRTEFFRKQFEPELRRGLRAGEVARRSIS